MHLKSFLMVLTAALGTVAGGTMVNSFTNSTATKAGTTFILTVNPSSQTLAQGASAQSAVSIISVNGFTGTVALSLFFPAARLPAVVNPSNVTVPSNGTAKATLTITTSTMTAIGNYTIVVLGITTHGKTSYASSLLTVQIVSNQDFAIISSPLNILNLAGTTNTTNIVLSSVNGYSGTVALSVTVPFGYITVTGGQNPVTLSPGGTAASKLQIITTSSTLLGTYNITITGTSSSHVHTTTISLTVVDPNPPTIEALTLNSYKFNSNTNVTLSIQNTGTTSVTLQSYAVRDLSGDAWSLTNWAGPTISPASIVPANILIGASCNNCIYTGIVGLFTQFTLGQTYIITVTTARNNQFSFTMTY